MQTMFGDQRRKIGSEQYKQQRSEDGALRHPELDELVRLLHSIMQTHCCRSVTYELILELANERRNPYV